VGIGRVVGFHHLGDAGDLGGGRGGAIDALAGDQDMDVAADLLRRGHCVQGRGLQGRVVMLGNDQNTHGSSSQIGVLQRALTARLR
jgi:hypothetical protein